jgi:hypothetical protein
MCSAKQTPSLSLLWPGWEQHQWAAGQFLPKSEEFGLQSLSNSKSFIFSFIFIYSIAKLSPSSSSSWAELALFLISPTTYPALPPPHILRNHHHISCAATTRASSEIAGNDQNLLTNICRSTLVKLKTIEKIEDDLHGRLLKWKMTKIAKNWKN